MKTCWEKKRRTKKNSYRKSKLTPFQDSQRDESKAAGAKRKPTSLGAGLTSGDYSP